MNFDYLTPQVRCCVLRREGEYGLSFKGSGHILRVVHGDNHGGSATLC